MSLGTSQNERMPDALNPEYFKVDERSIEDLYEEARNLAEALPFFDKSYEEASGTWAPFFDQEIDESDLNLDRETEAGYPPHLGLFVVFLKLFGYPQQQLNKLTASHLHFFYNKVLGQERKEVRPDKAFVFFELAKNISTYLLPEASALSAGKDGDGKEIIYTTDRQLFLSHSKITEFKAIQIEKGSKGSIKMYPFVNSQDGIGIPLEKEGWQPFGGVHMTGQSASIGFAVDSPMLLLKEGARKIYLSVSVDDDKASKLNADEFNALLTGPDGWIRKKVEEVTYEKGILTFSIHLNETDPPVESFERIKHSYELKISEWPILSILLKEGCTYNRYAYLQSIVASRISIRVDVEKAQSLLIRNNFGELDAGKAFHPFGYNPVKGANLFLGLEETFYKHVIRFVLRLNWKGLPDNFKNYYEGYLGPTNSLVSDKEDFKVTADVRRRGEWVRIKNRERNDNEFPLFDETLKLDTESGLGHRVSSEGALSNEDGLIRLTLSSPEHAFGHKLYPSVYAKAIISQMKEKPAPIPSEPYTPAVESVEMGYSAEDEIQQFFYVKPFGIEQVPAENNTILSGEFHQAGSLYMGIKNLNPPQQLSVFFDIEQEIQGEKPAPKIYYLSNTGWNQLPENQILSDSTLGLKQTGILLLNLPSDISSSNPQMPLNSHWIRISVEDNPENFDRILTVRTNVVSCTFTPQKDQSSESVEMNALPPGSINKLSQKRSEIKKIEQPYTSYGGRAVEKEHEYFTRVSERLRHKNRAISAWDMERLVLEEFPEIYKVSCLSHQDPRGLTVPGSVHVIVIPFLKEFNRSNVLKPIVPDSTLTKIKGYVDKLSSSNVDIHVTNPLFEEIKIKASVSFKMHVDAGYYAKQLQLELQQFLSPWAFRDETEIQLGSRLYRSSIIEFIETRPYINFIANIKLLKNGRLFEGEEISPEVQTLIVSADTHEINVVEPDAIVCQTNQGIEQMIVDINFEVQ